MLRGLDGGMHPWRGWVRTLACSGLMFVAVLFWFVVMWLLYVGWFA